jgi:PKD repeat protein
MEGKQNKRMAFKASLLIILSSITFHVAGQNLAQHNWYFGTSPNAIRFNRGNNKAQLITPPPPFMPLGSTGGSAVATDPATSNLLFYSDGSRIYDASHQPMTNGSGLSGFTNSNQPVVICPVPGQTNKYFVFTNTANFPTGGSINVSVVNMNLFGSAVFPSPPLGEVEAPPLVPLPIPKNTPIGGLANRSEGMIIVPHTNGTDYWLITHQNSSAIFSRTLIDAASYTSGFFLTTPTTPLGSTPIPVSVSNFSYNHKLGKLAVAVQSPGDNALTLNFDPATGLITFDRYLLTTGIATASTSSIYDIQWDIKGGQYIYISRTGEPGIPADVLQYDYTGSLPGVPSTIISTIYSAPSIAQSYGLQLAPDSAIYHIYQAVLAGPFLVEKLTKTDTIASEVIKTPLPFGNIDFNGKQFPSFLPRSRVNLTVNFTTAPDPVANPLDKLCQNNKITFLPEVSPNADSLVWDFGDGSPRSREWSPVHTFTNSGTFQVTLTAFYQGQKSPFTKPVSITPFNLQIQLNPEETACECELPINAGSPNCPTITQFKVDLQITQGSVSTPPVWSNGDTGNTLMPKESGYYYVTATDGTCSTYAGVNVKQYGLSDQRSNIWYFGDKAGLDFNPVTPLDPPSVKAISTSAMTAPEGCAIVCDRNGDVIFYTDGKNVYDKTNTLIPILPTGLNGELLSSQSALIVPVPGDETLYYIFTTQEIPGAGTNELRYSIFDLKKNNGNGLITQANVLLFSKSTERITANGQWLIAHEYGNSTFRSYPISNQGIGKPVYSDIGSVHSFNSVQSGQGYMKLGARDNLAVALSTGTENLVELFHLNDTTGVLSNYRKIVLPPSTGQVYGIEFASNGRRLFVSVSGTPSNIFEYFLDDNDILPPTLIPNPSLIIPAGLKLGAIQLAPDGRIYMAQDNTPSLATIDANGGTTLPLTPSSITFNSFDLPGRRSGLGLPNFVQQQGNGFGGPGFTFTGLCEGTPTNFVGTPTDAIDEFQWAFDDGGGSTEAAPTHLYPRTIPPSATTYSVSMRLTNRCGLDVTIAQDVIINPPPPRPTLAPASALCNGPITLDANSGNLISITSYLWNSGATTKTIVINNPANVSVTITDVNECTATANGIVVNNRPVLDLGPDLTVCEDNTTPNLNAQNPGANFLWTLNGAPNGNTFATQVVDTSLPAVLTYGVTVTDPVTLCTATDSKTYTVKVSPSFTLSGTNPTSCNTATGTVTLNLNSSTPAGGPYSFFVSGTSFNQQGFDQTAPTTIGPLPGVRAGAVSGIVQDQISGCTISTAIPLSDPAPYTFNTSIVGTNCDPVTLNVTTAPSVQLNRFQITNSATTALIEGPTIFSPTRTNFNTSPLPQGTYIIEVRDIGLCTVARSVTVNPVPAPVISISQNCLTLSASGGTTYSWTTSVPGSIVGPTNGSSIQITGIAGTVVTYTASDLTAACPGSVSAAITIPTVINPDFSQSNGCSNQVVLNAIPVGNFTYRWFKAGVFQPTLGGRLITLGQSEDGASYAVEVVDAVSGCFVRSAAKTVQVSGSVDAFVTGKQACEDNKPFTLNAATSATGAVTYVWAYNGSNITGQSTAALSDTREGTYRVTISKTTTCNANASIQVIKAPIPQGDLPNAVIICNDPDNKDPATSQVNLNPGTFTSYNWLKNEIALNITSQVLTATSEGIYQVDLTNSFGCTNSDETKVLNECIPKIVGPNAFRPGNAINSLNKEFFVYSFFITDNFEVAIFNRWGELVFSDTKKDFRWNGGYGNNPGLPAPGGTYSYVIKYQSSFRPEEGIKEQRGGIVLLR